MKEYVYIVFRCEKVIKVYKNKEMAEREVGKYLSKQDYYTKSDMEIVKKEVV